MLSALTSVLNNTIIKSEKNMGDRKDSCFFVKTGGDNLLNKKSNDLTCFSIDPKLFCDWSSFFGQNQKNWTGSKNDVSLYHFAF